MPPIRLELIQDHGDPVDPSRIQEFKAGGMNGFVVDFDHEKGKSILAVSCNKNDMGGLVTRHEYRKSPTNGAPIPLNVKDGEIVAEIGNGGSVEVPMTTKEMGHRIIRVTHIQPL